jgi:hypothetical protein
MTIADVAVSLLGGWLICVNAPTTSALFWQLLFHFSFTFSTRFSVFVTRPWISTGLAIFYIVAWFGQNFFSIFPLN